MRDDEVSCRVAVGVSYLDIVNTEPESRRGLVDRVNNPSQGQDGGV
jgi:hypothetical protein